MFQTRNSSQNTAEFVLLDQLVEEDHPLRKIDQYSENKGRPSLEPLILFKKKRKNRAKLADSKQLHGLRYCRLRGKRNVSEQVFSQTHARQSL
ncbi:Uncharacterised protein [Bacillus tequilensis]|nr:Uncharacterised protein [Bacillus tequilensis]